MKKLLSLLIFVTLYWNLNAQQWQNHTLIEGVSVVKEMQHADLDNDGDQDVVVATKTRFFWLENLDGNGQFSTPIILKPVATERFVIIDTDNDGDKDIIEGSNFFQNLGSGVFASQASVSNFGGRKVCASIDLNGDGMQDLLAAEVWEDRFTYNLYYHQNNGNNNFSSPQSLVSISNTFDIAVDDINNDGVEDIAIVSDMFTKVFINEDGQLNEVYTSNEEGTNIAIGDLTGTGALDIVIASDETGVLTAIFQNAIDDWDLEVLSNDYLEDNAFSTIQIKDIDNDMDNDILFCTNSEGNAFLRNIGNATSFELEAVHYYDLTQPINYVIDLDNDGINDVLSASTGTSTYKVSKFLGEGDGVFSLPTPLFFRPAKGSRFHEADLNNDGYSDLIEGRFVLDGNGDGTFANVRAYTNQFTFLDKPNFADFDNDDDLDLLASRGGDLFWIKNDGTGNLMYPDTVKVGSSTLYTISTADVVDLDGDGDIDVIAGTDAWGLNMYEELMWFENNSDNTFTRHILHTDVFIIQNLRVRDVDGDGDLDILTLTSDDFYIYENIGQNIFADRVKYFGDVIVEKSDIFFEDFDNDGDLDLLVSQGFTSFTRRSEWYRNNGDSWEIAQLLSAFDPPGSTFGRAYSYPVDIDGDGDLDILENETQTSNFRWFANDGSGLFTAVEEMIYDEYKIYSGDVFAMDIDGDGDKDPITVYSSNEYSTSFGQTLEDDEIQNLSWFENTIYNSGLIIVAKNAKPNCNNNGSILDASDDFLDVEVSIHASNSSGDYKLKPINFVADEIFNSYGDTIQFDMNIGSASSGINYEMSLTDIASAVVIDTILINNPGTCAEQGQIVLQDISSTCNPNITPFNENDDFYDVSILVEDQFLSDSFNVYLNGAQESIGTGAYGEIFSFTTLDGSVGNGDINILIEDQVHTSYTNESIVIDNGNCALPQSMNIASFDYECFDNNTIVNSMDDFYVVHITVDDVNLGVNYRVYVQGETDPVDLGTYGQLNSFSLSDQLVGDGDIALEIRDINFPDIQTSITLNDNQTCHEVQQIAISGVSWACNDNGTSTYADDDFFLVTLKIDADFNASGYNIYTQAGALLSDEGAYNENYTFATALGSANNSDIDLIVYDNEDGQVYLDVTVIDNGPCSLTSVENMAQLDAKISFIPNPFTNNVQVVFNPDTSDSYILEFYNSLGQKIRTMQLKEGTYNVDTSSFSSGGIFYRIINKDGIQQTKGLLIKT